MLKTKLLICIATWMAVTSAGAQTVTGNARYVDPFIGVDGGGNVFPGSMYSVWNGKIRSRLRQ